MCTVIIMTAYARKCCPALATNAGKRYRLLQGLHKARVSRVLPRRHKLRAPRALGNLRRHTKNKIDRCQNRKACTMTLSYPAWRRSHPRSEHVELVAQLHQARLEGRQERPGLLDCAAPRSVAGLDFCGACALSFVQFASELLASPGGGAALLRCAPRPSSRADQAKSRALGSASA